MASTPIPSLGGLNTVLDSVEMLKRAWSNFSLPAQFTPALSVEELDKRINELKTVEQWLTLNLNMLRGSIQGLELQLGAMNAVGAIGKAMQTGTASSPAPAEPPSSVDDRRGADEQPPPVPAAESSVKPSAETSAEPSAGLSAAVSPAAWWSLLQSQFSQIAQTALGAANPTAPTKTKPKAKAAKPATNRSKAAAPASRKPARTARKTAR